MHHVIGTAGHVDHGKTKLIEALTGQDTDRLKEEKDRGISVDLGFAPFSLPSGNMAGVVDVPGHEKFIHNMLAGIAGIDLVVLVIDVNEGIMPQTEEHVAIMELLGIKTGIIVLTKIDLAEADWIELMEEEIREQLDGSFLQNAPLIHTSVMTGQGISELKMAIDQKLSKVPSKDESGPVRMPIDRAFKISGFGTVVTGTLFSGTIDKDQQLEIIPGKTQTRARQLQVHGHQVEAGRAGQRLAINLPNVSSENLERGYVLSEPGYFSDVTSCDVRITMLKDVEWELKNGSPIHLHVGAGETVARVYFYGQKKLLPGENALAQLRLQKSLAIFRSDRFIIRSYSPVTTIGGGHILEHNAEKKPLNSQQVIDRLLALEQGDPGELVFQLVQEHKILSLKNITIETGIALSELEDIIQKLADEKKLVLLAEYAIAGQEIERIRSEIVTTLKEFHDKFPLRLGKPKAELISWLKSRGMNDKAASLVLDNMKDKGQLDYCDDFVQMPDFEPKPNLEQKKQLENIVSIFDYKGFRPPTQKELIEELGVTEEELREYLDYLLMTGQLIKIAQELYLSNANLEQAKQKVRDHFKEHETLSIGEWRDMLGTSRKYALPVLEYFDRIKLTRREEDVRVYLGEI